MYLHFSIAGCVSCYMRRKLCPYRNKPYEIDGYIELNTEDGSAVEERRCRSPPLSIFYSYTMQSTIGCCKRYIFKAYLDFPAHGGGSSAGI